MIEVFTIIGGLLLGMLGFLAKFIGSLCLIALAMIVFVILFIFLIGLGWIIGTFLLELASEKYSVFKREVEHEERNNNSSNS
jgi:hypothetical protein